MKKLLMLMVAINLSLGLFAQNEKGKKMDKMDHTGKMDKMHHMKDCVMMEDGKMMVMKDGKTMEMDKEMTMQNGATVMTDGNVKWKNGKMTMLKNGDCIYMDGKMAKMDHMKMDKMDKKKEP